MHLLEADSIQLEFGLRKILSDIYIKSETGKITGLLGRNGQGKTCLMNIIYGSLQASGKSVRFDHKPVFDAFKRPGLLVYLPQFNFIPRRLTLKRIFKDFNLEYAGFENYFPEFKTKYNNKIGSLSGGQRRLVEIYVIARYPARFVMLDEPFSHVMPVHVETINEIMAAEKQHKGFIITDHLYRYLIDVCDDIYVLAGGKTYLTKSVADIENLGYARL